MKYDIKKVNDVNSLIEYFVSTLHWKIDLDCFEDIEDITYDFDAEDIGLKEEAFAKISTLRQLRPLVDGQRWGIFCVEFDSKRFEITALRKVLSGLIPNRRNSAEHAVWDKQDLLFICFWGVDNNRTIGIAHFEDKESGLPQIKMISCAPAVEDFTQIQVFESRLKNLKWPENYVDHSKWQTEWSSAFTTAYRQTINDASTLTAQLAAEAQGLRNRILSILDVETSNGYVHLLFEKFKNTLIHDMTEVQFADMYAQTVVYGLFSARCMDDTQEDFSAAEAVECIPSTNPFLKSLMKECLGSQNNSKLSFDELEIGNVVDLLLHTKTDSIIQDFNRQTGGGREDPVIHFYEEFLEAYDKNQKVQRGVYYTPQPVVNFIVRAVDSIVKKEFGLEDGLASTSTKRIKYFRESKRRTNGRYRTQVEDTKDVPAIQVLDPSTGTGTFIRQTILQIYDNFKEKNSGLNDADLNRAWNEYVPNHLLPRLNAFELMMAPYAVAHMKLAMVLKDTGYNFNSEKRLKVYLTNTLEKAGNSSAQITLFDDPLALESVAANSVKKNEGINVVIGNPPYAGESANKGDWILSLIDSYKKEPGGNERLNERNPKWINDDYVKFIRLAQEYVSRAENGILAYICPHGFIDNPTFRGMRWNLAAAYQKIYILDLHGNAKKREVAGDGSKDENVFDIQQGVCIAIMIHRRTKGSSLADVYHADLYGMREKKYDYLNRKELDDVAWEKVNLKEPFYLFKPTEDIGEDIKRFDISKLFKKSVMGFQTHRDSFAVAIERNDIIRRLKDMENSDITDDQLRAQYGVSDNRDWKLDKARSRLLAMSEEERLDKVTLCQYRLFDERWCYLDEAFMDYPRSNVFSNVTNKDNYVFGVGRQGLAVGDIEWCLATVSHFAMDANIFRRGGVTASPLYLYDSGILGSVRRANMDEDIIDEFSEHLGCSFTQEEEDGLDRFAPIDIIDYILAVLYSHKYRERYKDELKINYPQIPYPTDSHYFWEMVDYGAKLRNILTLDDPVTNCEYDFSGGEGKIEKYKLIKNRIYINKTDYFFSVTEKELDPIWAYTIGGNQPLQKWLKDRKGNILSEEEISHYLTIMASIEGIMELMEEIDSIIKC